MPFVSTPTATFDPVTNTYCFSIPENSAAGTLIGHIRYDGGGAGTAYFSVRGTDRASVRLSSSGELTLAAGVDLDFEGSQAQTSLSIDFSVIFFGTDGSFQSARTNGSMVKVTDIVEPPEIVITPEQQVFAEDIPAQTVIARIQDANLQAGEVSQALSGDHADLFSIVGREIVLTNPAGFDFETIGSSIELTVTTTLSRPDAPAIAPQTFSIQVGDVNEPITWSQPEFTFAIDENSGPGTIVGTVSATDGDGDRVTYRLVGDDAGLFEIDSSSGEITVAAGAALDFEAHQTAGTQLDVSVVATAPHRSGPPPSTSTKQIDITLADLDEAPVLTLTNQVASIDEHAALDSAILTVTASDPDGDVTDIFVTGRNANLFTIVDNQLVVANPAALDFETLGNSVDLTLTAVSTHPGEDSKRVSQDVSIQLNDIDEPPAFINGICSFTIAENRQGPVDLGSVLAVDPDGDTVIYQLTGPNAEKFTVGRDGTLRLREGQSLDFESIEGGSFELTVTAVSQGGGIASSAVKTATIEVTDSPEPPEFRDQQGGVINAASAAIAENVAGGELLSLNVVNPDGDGDVDLFVTTHADKFYIDGNVLKLRDNVSLDHESVAGGTMDVRVTASKGPNPLTDISHMMVTLTVRDVDEAPTTMSLSTATVDVSEFSSARKLADIGFADDGLGTNRGQVADNDIFEIRNGTELWLKADAPLDFETAQQHRVTVNPDATGTGDGPAAVEFVLSVTNGDDKPASMALSATSFRIDEGTATARKLADIGFADDGLGTNRGQVADNDIFEIRNGTELWLKADAPLDFETAQQHRVTVNPDATGTGDGPAAVEFVLSVTNGDDKPASMALSATSFRIDEGTATARKLADIGFADDGLGTNRGQVADNDIFEIRNGTELWLKANAPLDFETAQQHRVTVNPDATGTGDDPASVTLTLNVVDVDEKPASMSLSGTIPSVSEFVSTPMKLADLAFDDDALGTNHALVEENDIFDIRNGTELWLKAGAPLDFETARQHHVTINPDVTGTGDDPGTLTFTLDVTNGDDIPTAMRLSRTSFSVQEGPARARKLANVTFTDDGLGTNRAWIDASDIFDIRNGTELWLKAGAPLDFETARQHHVTINPDVTGTGDDPASVTFTLDVTNIDDKPVSMILSKTNMTVSENHAGSVKVADVTFVDDGLGTNRATIEDSNIFDIRNGAELWLKAGAPLDFETASQHHVTVNPNVTGVGRDPSPVTFILSLSDDDDAPTGLNLLNPRTDWAENETGNRRIAVVEFEDDDKGTNSVTLSDTELFEVRSGRLIYFKNNIELDFEAQSQHELTITPKVTGGGRAPDPVTITINVLDRDEKPTAMELSSSSATVFTSFHQPIKLADITFTDDALGSNRAVISNHDLVEIRRGTELWTKKNAFQADGVGSHEISIFHDTTGSGRGPQPVTFTLTVRTEISPSSPDEQIDNLRFPAGVTEIFVEVVDGDTRIWTHSNAIPFARSQSPITLTGFTDGITSDRIADPTIKIRKVVRGTETSLAERLSGTNGDDVFFGDEATDSMTGRDGDDRMYGYGGNDYLNGGDGDDIMSGGAGNDRLQGTAGADLLIGGLGRDLLFGYKQYFYVPHGDRDVFDITLTSSFRMADVIGDFGKGTSKLRITNGTDVWYRAIGGQTILYDAAHNGNVHGIISNYEGPLSIDDFTDGTIERVHAITPDIKLATSGNDIFRLVARHNDVGQASVIRGFSIAADKLAFDSTVDEVWYQLTEDGLIVSGYDRDTASPRHFAFLEGVTTSLAASHLQDSDLAIRKLIVGTTSLFGASGTTGTSLNDVIIAPDQNSATNVRGLAGNDHLVAGIYNSYLYGGSGRDVFDVSYTAGAVADSSIIFDFSRGSDKLLIQETDQVWVRKIASLTNEDITVIYDSADQTGIYAVIWHHYGNLSLSDFIGGNIQTIHRITVPDSDDTITGTYRDDHLFGEGGNDHINGGANDDYLYGGAGNDILNGGSGDDYLQGGTGTDILTGSTGSDRFSVRFPKSALTEADRITDFGNGRDRLDVRYRKVWFKKVDTDGDGAHDATVVYNNANASGGILAILEGYTDDLDRYDFYSTSTVVTEIA